MSDVRNISIDLIRENPDAMRAVNKQGEAYKGLVVSIMQQGFNGAITVRKVTEGNEEFYVLVDGMHRFSAAKDAGLTEIPCVVGKFEDFDHLAYMVMGNCHKADTKASEYRKGIVSLLNAKPLMTLPDVAAMIGKSMTWVNNILSLGKIDNENINKLIDDGSITLANAFALAKLPADEQINFITEAQNLKAEEFIPLVNKRATEIRDAKRSGEDPASAEFAPVEYMQKMRNIKDQRISGDIADILIAETGITTAKDGFILALNWVLHNDPLSIAEQKSEWENKQRIKNEKKAQQEAAKKAKKREEAEAKLRKAAEEEALAKEAANA